MCREPCRVVDSTVGPSLGGSFAPDDVFSTVPRCRWFPRLGKDSETFGQPPTQCFVVRWSVFLLRRGRRRGVGPRQDGPGPTSVSDAKTGSQTRRVGSCQSSGLIGTWSQRLPTVLVGVGCRPGKVLTPDYRLVIFVLFNFVFVSINILDDRGSSTLRVRKGAKKESKCRVKRRVDATCSPSEKVPKFYCFGSETPAPPTFGV